MSPFLYFLSGLLVGWLLQLLLEVRYFRRKTLEWRDQAAQAVTARTASEKQLAGVRSELVVTKAELASTVSALAAARGSLALMGGAPTAGSATGDVRRDGEPALGVPPYAEPADAATIDPAPAEPSMAEHLEDTSAPEPVPESVTIETPVETRQMAPGAEPDGTLDASVDSAPFDGVPVVDVAAEVASMRAQAADASAASSADSSAMPAVASAPPEGQVEVSHAA
jgi:hypothetical protein